MGLDVFSVFCKEFQTFNGFLSSIQDYFSAEACLPFMGHHLGDSLHKKVGVLLIWTTVVAVVFGIICCICTLEYRITYYATKKMPEYRDIYPDSTREELYEVCLISYSVCRESLIGPNQWDLIGPSPIETVLPDKGLF